MVEPERYRTTKDIRDLIAVHLDELTKEGQEIRITRGDHTFIGTINRYISRDDVRHDEEDRDHLHLETRAEEGYTIPVAEIKMIEILSSQQMTNALALRQMRQMEAIVMSEKK